MRDRKRVGSCGITVGASMCLLLMFVTMGSPTAADTYPRQPGIAVQKYSFDVTLSDASDELSVNDTIDVRFIADGIRGIDLDLCNLISQPHPADPLNPCLTPQPRPLRGATAPDGPAPTSVGKGMTVTEILAGDQRLEFQHSHDRLHIVFPKQSRAGQQFTFTIRYHGVPAAGLFIGKNSFGYRVFFTDNWPNKARNWLATIDHISVKVAKTISVTAPRRYEVISNGLLKEQVDLPGDVRRTVWEESVPIPSWQFSLGVAQMAVEYFGSRGDVPFSAWLFPQNRDAGLKAVAPLTQSVFDFYNDHIGPYAYEKLAQVEATGDGGATEPATTIFYYGGFGPLSHEMAHQWFGDSVTESDWDDVWLSEGFATYFALLYTEHHEGHDVFLRGLREASKAAVNYALAHPTDTIVHNNLANDSDVFFNATQIYQGGAMVLHSLRGVLGDQNFWAGIRLYSTRFRNSSATTDDFRQAMEDACHASHECSPDGDNLSWFFHEWLNRGGVMQLKGTWRYDPETHQLKVALDQMQAQGLYRMPMEIGITLSASATSAPSSSSVTSAGMRQTVKVMLATQHTVASFPLGAAPLEVQLDPNTWVPLMRATFEQQ
jgi:aminopeptidase N